jgi:hypothetical protein
MMDKAIVIRNTGTDWVFTSYNAALYEMLLAMTQCKPDSGTWGKEKWIEQPSPQVLIEIVDIDRFVPIIPPAIQPPV